MTYGQAAYDRKAERSIEPREVEAAAFVFVNRLLAQAATADERIRALSRNHRLWSLLLTDIGLTSNALPPILKKDLVSVGAWSMSYSIAAMSQDRPLGPLVEINADMIEALRPSVARMPPPLAPRSSSQGIAVAV